MQSLELRIGLEAVLPLDETPDPAVHRFLGRGREFLGAGVGDLGDRDAGQSVESSWLDLELDTVVWLGRREFS